MPLVSVVLKLGAVSLELTEELCESEAVTVMLTSLWVSVPDSDNVMVWV